MKRAHIIFMVGAVALMFSITALATTSTGFTDEGKFATWFTPSVEKMKDNGVINGYPNGTFGPEKFVNRAELSVMLDKLAAAVGKPLHDSHQACTLEFRYGLKLVLQDVTGARVRSATISVQKAGTNSSDTSFSEDSEMFGTYNGIGEGEGYYTVTINKNGFSDYTETVKLEKTTDGCHVMPQTKTITLVPKSLQIK